MLTLLGLNGLESEDKVPQIYSLTSGIVQLNNFLEVLFSM